MKCSFNANFMLTLALQHTPKTLMINESEIIITQPKHAFIKFVLTSILDKIYFPSIHPSIFQRMQIPLMKQDLMDQDWFNSPHTSGSSLPSPQSSSPSQYQVPGIHLPPVQRQFGGSQGCKAAKKDEIKQYYHSSF